MIGSLKLQKSYQNKHNKKIEFKNNEIPKYYFDKENNLVLDYYKEFDYKKLKFGNHKFNEEIPTSVGIFLDYYESKLDTDIDELKETFWENSHSSFLYAKSMCQDLLKNGVHHPIGIVALNPSLVKSKSKNFHTDTGWRVRDHDLVIFMYSGSARLRYFRILEWRHTPAFIQTPLIHNIKWDGESIRLDSLEKLTNEYSNHVMYDTLFYQQDKFFYKMKHELEEHGDDDNLFLNRTNKYFGIDVEHECLSHLVCCDIQNDHKTKNWESLDIPKYNEILKNTFPLKIYIRSDNKSDFEKCKENIISVLSYDIEVEFISVLNKNEINQKKGFAFFTDSSVYWNDCILKLFYFTNSYEKEVEFKKGVSVINCEF